MSRIEKDEEREERIYNEAIVDCYDEYERVAGWYHYLEDLLSFPFKAKCIAERSLSPLKPGETVDVVDMADQDDCRSEMFVLVHFMDRKMGVPLAQLQPVDVDAEAEQAVADWHYWMGRGYEF